MAKACLTALFATFLLAAPAGAKPKPAPAVPVAPAMWEVRDADTTVTILGTVHVLPPGVTWFRQPQVRALDGADALVVEAVIPERETDILATVLRLARGQNLPRLEARVPPEKRAALRATMARLRLPPLDAYETWYAALAIANADNSRRGLDPRLGVDAILTARAKLFNKPVVGLETPEGQLTYFDALTEEDQRKLLVAALDDLADSDRRMDALVADWLAGRTDALAAALNEDLQASPTIRKLLLTDRNARWAAWIAERMKQPGRVFVAVGAGHLAGPGSVQEALKAYGLAAVPVTDPPAVVEKPRRRR